MAGVDTVVVGAGAVGLAAARALAAEGLEVLILEADDRFGSGVSSRNSEVVHAGIYYPAGSLKARLCLRGRELLYRFCEARGVPHRRCGKLIVAAEERQAPELAVLERAAAANGVRTLRMLGGAEARALEPDLSAAAALHSPDTGVVDSHAFMAALLGEAEAGGATLVRRTRVERVTRAPNGWGVHLAGEPGPAVEARLLVNAAGLDAHLLVARIEGLGGVPAVRYAKGSYFGHAGRVPFRRLIYPLPEPGGLGVHLTLDMAGRARFGPDVEWVDRPDYAVDPGKRGRFADAIRRWWPGLDPERLAVDYAGVRPKLSGPGEPPADFLVQGPRDHGLPGLVNLLGIESPGLTASLALAELVAAELAERSDLAAVA